MQIYLWDSLVTLELISLIRLVGPPHMDPLAVKLLDNLLYIIVWVRGMPQLIPLKIRLAQKIIIILIQILKNT